MNMITMKREVLNTHSKGERVKIPLFTIQSRKKERDNGHDSQNRPLLDKVP